MKLDSSAAAPPPDVRRGYASPLDLDFTNGLCPRCGLCPNLYGPKAEPGAQPLAQIYVDGEAKPRLTSGGVAAAISVVAGNVDCAVARQRHLYAT